MYEDMPKERELYLESLKYDTLRLCKIMYGDDLCWECDKGWNELLYEFSLKCEELNVRFYKKYRCKIVSEQIKEKFGTLRLYCNVITDPPRPINWLINTLESLISSILSKFDFKFVKVIDSPRHTIHEIGIHEKDSNENAKPLKHLFKTEYHWCGRRITVRYVECFEENHAKPTKHLVIYFVKRIMEKIQRQLIKFGFQHKPTKEAELARSYMCTRLQELTKEYEERSCNVCEKCGDVLNVNSSKKCMTIGWIRTLCENCAKNSNVKYEMDGKIYQNGVLVG